MTQNVYDRPDFFESYSRLPRSVDGLAAAPEWPALQALMPDLSGRRVVDLGCGFGWFCRWARAQGATDVLGLDVSANMLARARATTDDPAIRYAQADLERPELPVGAFDLAYSSLALHYIVDLDGLLGGVARALVPAGRFIASVEHPILTAPRAAGWVTHADGHRTWPLDGYLHEGPRVTDWLSKGVVKQHRTIGTYLGLLWRHGFVLSHLEEWGPTDAQIAEHPEWAVERERPMFMLMAASR